MGDGLVKSTTDARCSTHADSNAAIFPLSIHRPIICGVMWKRITTMIASEIVVDIKHIGQQ